MIKYSLVLLGVIGLIVGCESDCCVDQTGGTTPSNIAPTAIIVGLTAGQNVTVDSFLLSSTGSDDSDGSIVSKKWTVDGTEVAEGYALPEGTHQVCLLVTDDGGLTNETCGAVVVNPAVDPAPDPAPVAIITLLPETCTTTGETLNVSGSTSTGDPVAYAWEPASIGTTASGTIACPSAGESQEVCLTVTNSVDTNRVCKSVTADAVVVEPSCSPSISAKDLGGNVVEAFTAGSEYTFENNVTGAICADAVCTWSVKSLHTNGSYFTCLIGNSHIGTSDEANPSPHVTLDDNSSNANISISTCSENYVQIEIDLNCTNPAYSQSKPYILNQP